MNTNGMNVLGKIFNMFYYLDILLHMIRWIRYEEDYDFEMERWQGKLHSNGVNAHVFLSQLRVSVV